MSSVCISTKDLAAIHLLIHEKSKEPLHTGPHKVKLVTRDNALGKPSVVRGIALIPTMLLKTPQTQGNSAEPESFAYGKHRRAGDGSSNDLVRRLPRMRFRRYCCVCKRKVTAGGGWGGKREPDFVCGLCGHESCPECLHMSNYGC